MHEDGSLALDSIGTRLHCTLWSSRSVSPIAGPAEIPESRGIASSMPDAIPPHSRAARRFRGPLRAPLAGPGSGTEAVASTSAVWLFRGLDRAHPIGL
jgi:hypothetical protein